MEPTPSETPRSRFLTRIGYPALLLAINFLIGYKLFTIVYTVYLESNEGTFIAIAKHIASGQFEFGWWPLWDLGIPYQNTYLPLLHLLVGGTAWITGGDVMLLYHRICAGFYVIAPVALYAMAYGMTKRVHLSFAAAAVFSLISPANFLLPMVRRDLGSVLFLRRLNILDYYGEGPYTAMLATLPLAILFLYRALTRRQFLDCVLAGIFCGATVLFNAFGAVAVAICCLALLVTIRTERFWTNLILIAFIGVLTYAWISPLLPPSVVAAIRANSPTVGGDFRFNARSAVGAMLIGCAFWLTWLLTRRLDPATRFFLLLTEVASGIVLLGFHAEIFVVPQTNRYQGLMDLALCLALVFFCARFLPDRWPRFRTLVLAVLVLGSAYQLRVGIKYAQRTVRGGEVFKSAPYRIAEWANQNMRGRRMMVSGAHSFHFSVFSDTPQLHGGHDPMLPNDILNTAVFVIYSGLNAGEHDASISTTWLKALGAHAIAVPGPTSTEHYKPFANPSKFDGVLPVLWREGGDTIYDVPTRSDSLAHVVPDRALVRDQPINGLDTTQMEAYVAALENPDFPEAPLIWRGWNHASINARVQPGQSLSVQMNSDPGWHATVGGETIPTRKDGLGLLVITPPRCEAGCTVQLDYDGGTERKATLGASGAVMILVLGLYVRRRQTTSISRV